MAERIARKVDAAGGRTFYVGGMVRDRVLGKENKDIDIEIHGISAAQLRQILESLGQLTEMGVSFGIFGLKGYDLDIAMPRSEKATGRGHKDFDVFVDPFLGTRKAALRRDFTMNALMEDVLTGEVLDYFGGIRDLKDGILRHVNDRTFAEDPLRVLRGAQFAARFEFSIAPETIALSKTMDLTALPKERVFAEMEKALLKAARPSIFFEDLRRMQQLHDWLPELEALIGIEQDPRHHPEGDAWTHTMQVLDSAASLRNKASDPLAFMLSALAHDLGKAETTTKENGRIHAYGHDHAGVKIAGEMIARVTNEKKLAKYVCNMTAMHMRPNMLAEQKAGKKAAMKMLDASICPEDLLLLAKADRTGRRDAEGNRNTEAYLKRRLEQYHELMERPYVQGRDLVAAGEMPGPEFTQALAYAHKLRLAGVDKENALRQTLSYLKTQDCRMPDNS